MPYVVGLTTVATRREGERIARRLVERRLAACVNLLPGAVSFYRWKRKLCREREVLLVVKTSRARLKALEKELGEIHPYELPEWIALPIAAGSRRYLAWLREGLR